MFCLNCYFVCYILHIENKFEKCFKSSLNTQTKPFLKLIGGKFKPVIEKRIIFKR